MPCIKFGAIYPRRWRRKHRGYGDTFYINEVFAGVPDHSNQWQATLPAASGRPGRSGGGCVSSERPIAADMRWKRTFQPRTAQGHNVGIDHIPNCTILCLRGYHNNRGSDSAPPPPISLGREVAVQFAVHLERLGWFDVADPIKIGSFEGSKNIWCPGEDLNLHALASTST